MFSIVMVFGSTPADPWLVPAGVGLVSLASVPFGLAVGELAPHELEGVLILIGVVGVQLTLDSGQAIARLLPFWGAQRLLDRATDASTSIGAAIYVALLYADGALHRRRLHHAPPIAGAARAGERLSQQLGMTGAEQTRHEAENS